MRKTKYEYVAGRYFTWRLCQRDGVYYADGRSNDPSPGRHSLGTKDREVAIADVHKLDLIKAVELGLASPAELETEGAKCLSLEEGVALYLENVQRARVTGGVRPKTKSRYKAVFDKFTVYCKKQGISSWNGITARLLQRYAAYLDDEGYAYRTEFLELTTVKQATNWLIESGQLPENCRIRLPLTKPTGTDTHCWKLEELEAIFARCNEIDELFWLGRVLLALTCTGMRISELAGLRWSDVDFQNNSITLTDETGRVRGRGAVQVRQIKNRHGRTFPINAELRPILESMNRHRDGRVFHGPRGGILSPDVARRTLIKEVLKPLQSKFETPKGEIGFEHGRLHSFRHYFCSTCANRGVPEQVVMRWLGHRDSQMVKHYYHLHDDEAQRQMKKINFVGRAGTTVVSGQTA